MKRQNWIAVLLVLCLTLSLLPFGAAAAGFTDVADGAYYSEAVGWAVNHDPQITNGTSPTTFSPANTCKRCEVVTFLWRAFGAEKMTGENPFVDVKPTDYFYDAAVWAVREGVTNGTDDTHFSPSSPCTREQVATFLWRASGKPDSAMQASPFADVLNKLRYSYDPILWAFENGVTNGKTVNTFAPSDPCTRGQIVTFLYRALAKPLDPVKPDGKLHFLPKVAAQYLTEIFGETMVETWFNLVDAVMAGKDTFACPDQHTYDWVMGQFPNKCFPVLLEVIDYAEDREHSVKNGVASFTYKVPREKAAEMIEEFAALVEDILNETMKPDYSDFEKALSLYIYFQKNYTYDYQAAEDNDNGKADYVSSYRLLTGKTGICHEIATAYSYLLMQVGVDAMTVMGANHEWSYIRLNGKNYHIDATWALNVVSGDLRYFLMTDAERRADSYFDQARFLYCSNYSQDHPHPDYKADDETFSRLWSGTFDSLDHENRILNYVDFGGWGETTVKPFSYKGW